MGRTPRGNEGQEIGLFTGDHPPQRTQRGAIVVCDLVSAQRALNLTATVNAFMEHRRQKIPAPPAGDAAFLNPDPAHRGRRVRDIVRNSLAHIPMVALAPPCQSLIGRRVSGQWRRPWFLVENRITVSIYPFEAMLSLPPQPMATPPLRFAIDDPVAIYLDHFPDLAVWLSAAGCPSGAATATWQEISKEPETLLTAIAIELRRPHWDETIDWAQESLTDLVHHLIDVHHAYLRAELPRLQHLWTTLARDHKHLTHERERFTALAAALISHLDQEERELFPLCLAIDQTRFGLALPSADLLRAKLHHLDADHLDRKIDLDALMQQPSLLDSLEDPRAAALVTGMKALVSDLHVHAEEETSILMPGVTHLHDMLDTRPIRRWAPS